jgi:hypothetical protein
MNDEAPDMDERDIVAALKREYDAAESYYTQLRDLQWAARDYYEGRPFGNEEDGQSQIVLPDVQEACDYMVTSTLETFVSGDHVVEFEATDEDDEDQVADATAAVNYNFMREQDGYGILHDICTDGLIEKYGVVKSISTTKEKVTRHPIQLDPEIDHQLQMGILGGMKGTEVEHYDGQSAHIKRTQTRKVFVDMPVPSEEFRFSPMARNEDGADYLAHVSRKTRSELVGMGFDKDQVYDLPAFAAPLDYNRDYLLGNFRDAESSPALQEVMLCEEYARIDVDGDGIAERIKAFRVETTILIDAATGKPSIETVEDQPFSVFTPFPRPHRLAGYSLADKVMDLQLARSTVARQLFDGMYNANRPRPVVAMNMADENTIDDILNPIAGSPIRVKQTGAVEPYQTSFDVGKSLQVLEWVTGERESRTGITRLNQGLDADALNKTASGTAMMQAQGKQQELFVARNLANTVGRMFAKKYRLMKAEAEPFKIKVDGNYKTVDPSQWPEDVNMVIRVGLGSNSKDKRIQYRMAIAPMMAEGLTQGLVTPDNVFNAMDGLVRDMGLGTGDDFWKDPNAPPEIDPGTGQPKQEAQKPDPAAEQAAMQQQLEQAKLQIQQQKVQGDQQIAQQKAEADAALTAHKNETQAQLTAQKHEMHFQAAHAKIASDAQLSEAKTNLEGQLDMHRAGLQAAVELQQAHLQAETQKHISKNKVTQDRAGGSANA